MEYDKISVLSLDTILNLMRWFENFECFLLNFPLYKKERTSDEIETMQIKIT